MPFNLSRKNIFILTVILLISVLFSFFVFEKTNHKDSQIDKNNDSIKDTKTTEISKTPGKSNKRNSDKNFFYLGVKKKKEVRDGFQKCLRSYKLSDYKKIYEDLVMIKYKLPQKVFECIKNDFDFGKEKVLKNDIYINSFGEMIFYKGTSFTGNEVIICSGQ